MTRVEGLDVDPDTLAALGVVNPSTCWFPILGCWFPTSTCWFPILGFTLLPRAQHPGRLGRGSTSESVRMPRACRAGIVRVPGPCSRQAKCVLGGVIPGRRSCMVPS